MSQRLEHERILLAQRTVQKRAPSGLSIGTSLNTKEERSSTAWGADEVRNSRIPCKVKFQPQNI